MRCKDQLIYVKTSLISSSDVVRNDANWLNVNDVRDLVALMLKPSPRRAQGVMDVQPVLIRAAAGTGKTWLTKQATFYMAEQLSKSGSAGMPLVVTIQRLARVMNTAMAQTGRDIAPTDLLRMYIEYEYKSPSTRALLLQAYRMRELRLLLDGVDEAAGLRSVVESWIHGVLVPSGNAIQVTSRPEGVDISLYGKLFVVLDLKPLSDAQQRKVMDTQLQGSLFFQHLFSLTNIRKQHDKIYAIQFPTKDLRSRIETLVAPDRFLLPNRQFDPAQRQRDTSGDHIIRAHDGEPTSEYLRALHAALTSSFDMNGGVSIVEQLDAALHRELLPPMASEEQVKTVLLQMVGDDMQLRVDQTKAVAIGTKLGLLVTKLRRTEASLTCAELWARIVSETDELYVVAEQMLPVFSATLRELVLAVGFRAAELKDVLLLGPLKDPVRTYEKAQDDYASRFGDGELAVACVMDILRSRVVCKDCAKMVALIELIGAGFTHRFSSPAHAGDGSKDEVEAPSALVGEAKLKPMRIKNK